MRDVERGDVSSVIAPQHRTLARIGNRESPDCWIEIRNTHSRHSIFSVSVSERIAEYRVQERNVGLMDPVWSIRRRLLAPGSRNGHYATPAGSSSSTSVTAPPADDSTIDDADAGS